MITLKPEMFVKICDESKLKEILIQMNCVDEFEERKQFCNEIFKIDYITKENKIVLSQHEEKNVLVWFDAMLLPVELNQVESNQTNEVEKMFFVVKIVVDHSDYTNKAYSIESLMELKEKAFERCNALNQKNSCKYVVKEGIKIGKSYFVNFFS